MTTVDERARQAAEGARRAAAQTDADAILRTIEGADARRSRWIVPATAVAAAAAVVAAIVIVPRLVGADARLEIDDPVGSPTDNPAPEPTRGDPTVPETWQRIDDPDLTGPAFPTGVVNVDGRLIAFGQRLVEVGDGAFQTEGSTLWRSDDGVDWEVDEDSVFAAPDAEVVAVVDDDGVAVALTRGTAGQRMTLQLWRSEDGRSWQPDVGGMRAGALPAGFMPIDLLATSEGLLIVGAVAAEDDESGLAHAVVLTIDDGRWAVRDIDGGLPAFLSPGDATTIDGQPVIFGSDGERALLWYRSGPDAWSRRSLDGLTEVAFLAGPASNLYGLGSGPAGLVEFRGPLNGPIDVQERSESLALWDVIAVDGVPVAIADRGEGPDAHAVVVEFLTDEIRTTELPASRIARGITQHGDALVVVGEAGGRTADGFDSGAAVWRGPPPPVAHASQ